MIASAACPLAFDPSTHTYTLNGVRVPSVTQVLKSAGYIRLDGVPAAVLEEARDRGQRVHQALHFMFEDDLDDASIDDEVRLYLLSARQYLERHVRQVLRAEMRVWSGRHYCAGTLDILGVDRDGQPFIGDFKTGDPADVAADLQTGAYAAFLLEMAVGDPELRAIVQVGRHLRRRSIRLFGDGRIARGIPYSDHRDFIRFMNALNVYHDQATRPGPFVAWDEER